MKGTVPCDAAVGEVVELDAHHGHGGGDAGEVVARVALQQGMRNERHPLLQQSAERAERTTTTNLRNRTRTRAQDTTHAAHARTKEGGTERERERKSGYRLFLSTSTRPSTEPPGA